MISFQRTLSWILSAVLMCTGGAVWAADSERARLDALARQSMYAYKMTKSVCLVMMGAETRIHAEVAFSTSDTFDAQMDALIDGDAVQNFPAEQKGHVRADLVAVRTYAKTMTSSARQIASGDVHGVPVALLLQRHKAVSEKIQDVWVKAAQAQSGNEILSPYLTTVQAAHKMNSEAQKVLRDLCLIHMDIEKDATQIDLAQSIAEFEELNVQLKAGNVEKRYIPAPNIHIKIGYDKVASRWKILKPMLEAAVAGEPMELRDMQLASVMGDAIHKQIDDILRRYEQN